MKRIASIALACSLTVAGATALFTVASGANGSSSVPRASVREPSEPAQHYTGDQADMLAKRAAGEPLPVVDSETGRTSGSVLPADLDRQDDQVDQDLLKLGILSGDDERWEAAAAALMVIHAAPVTDADGVTVGYMGPRFIPQQAYSSAAKEAQARLDQVVGP